MKPYLKLLMAREGKEVLGKRGSNLWLLTLVLTAMFTSIAFSHGSMNYLKDKMEDPFTNWFDIPVGDSRAEAENIASSLDNAALQQRFGFSPEVHQDYEGYFDMRGGMYLHCRHFSGFDIPLIKRGVLHPSNVVAGCVADSTTTLRNNHSLGLIVTADVIRRFGYDPTNPDSIPSYIYYNAYNPGADSLGYQLIGQSHDFLLAPLPIIAVVRRLPGSVDMMATNYMYQQKDNPSASPYLFRKHLDYTTRLRYFVPSTCEHEAFVAAVKGCLPDSIKGRVDVLEERNADVETWRPGKQMVLSFGSDEPQLTPQQWLAIDQQIQHKTAQQGVVRIYHYETSRSTVGVPDFVSINFTTLDSIRSFENFMKTTHKKQLDMSLVASKENFNAVTVMAGVLSSAMVLFSLVCIIMFLVNMLQGYFQKVKRNIGTFKAFGMNASELIYAYTLILILIVSLAVVMALFITWIFQLILPQKEGFDLLALWNPTTYIAAIVVFLSTIATVSIVMSRMLSQTPGDLIYDR